MEPPVGFGKKCPYRLAYRVSYYDQYNTTEHFFFYRNSDSELPEDINYFDMSYFFKNVYRIIFKSL